MSKARTLIVARPMYRRMNERLGPGTITRRQAIEGAIAAINEYLQGRAITDDVQRLLITREEAGHTMTCSYDGDVVRRVRH